MQPEQRIWAEKVIPHPDYNDVTYDNDFMLIKLSEPAVFDEYVQPISLATTCSQEAVQFLVSGWGNQINTRHRNSVVKGYSVSLLVHPRGFLPT